MVRTRTSSYTSDPDEAPDAIHALATGVSRDPAREGGISRTARAALPPATCAEVPAHCATPPQSRTSARAAPPPAVNSEVPAHSATPSTPETAQAQSPPINQSTFEYRGQTYGPIAKWPGSYASEETIHSPSGDFAYLREWLAEQRRGPHSGQFVSDNDDLLRLSSDEEDGIDEPGVLKRAAVYCSPQTDSHKERHAIYSNGITVTGGLKMHDTGFNSRAS